MKFTFALLFLLIVLAGFSQSDFMPVDRKAVEKLVSDPSLPTHYPNLLARLKSYDSTLTLEDYRLLYYGFVFQDDYSPYGDDGSKAIKAAFEKKAFTEAIKICDRTLEKNPVSLRAYNYKLIALSKLANEEALFQQTRGIYSRLLNAIVSSGDGLACPSAFRVISVSDEYDLMYNYFEIKTVRAQRLETPCDRIDITPSEYFKANKMYFDVSEGFMAMDKMFKKKE
jgi:hypothetical protein